MIKESTEARVASVEEYDISADYIFTEDERKELAKDLAQKNIEKQMLDDEKKAVTSKFAADINAKTSDINLLAQYLTSGKKMKVYRCTLDFDMRKKQRLWKDKETGKVIKIEPMRTEDYQMKMA